MTTVSYLPGASSPAAALSPSPDQPSAFAMIRGRRIDLHAMVAPKLFDPAHREQLRQQVQAAKPFPHLVADGWFDPVLLELVREEFDLFGRGNWRILKDEQQQYHRSTRTDQMGPASHLYFSIVNSGWFVAMLAEITGFEDLMADAGLAGGGLHETREGGKFGVHRDFDKHVRHGVDNKMVFITYLNKNWDPAWGAALELWDAEMKHSVSAVVPELGRSILLLHGPASYHGHPLPMTAPPGQTRRSVTTYYYQNAQAVQQRMKRVTSVFLVTHRSKRFRRFVIRLMPPILVDAIKKVVSR